MKIDEKILNRLEELIIKGQSVLKSEFSRSGGGIVYFGDHGVDSGLSNEWAISCLSILSRVFGKNSDHYEKFNQLFPKLHDYSPARQALGILKAAKDDYENGYLFDTRTLIEAEIFDEFIEQVEELLKKGYYQAAAIIAGCVLEDCLRKLCDKNSIPLPAKATIEPMNVELAKAGIYNKLWQKKITSLADLRNKAAHNLGGFIDKDVEDMIRDVRRFMEDYFS